MKRVVVRPPAAADIEDAYNWYESRHAGLGDEFLAALQAVQDRLLEHREAHPVVHRYTRRALIERRLPYASSTASTGIRSFSSLACTYDAIRAGGNAVLENGLLTRASAGRAPRSDIAHSPQR